RRKGPPRPLGGLRADGLQHAAPRARRQLGRELAGLGLPPRLPRREPVGRLPVRRLARPDPLLHQQRLAAHRPPDRGRRWRRHGGKPMTSPASPPPAAPSAAAPAPSGAPRARWLDLLLGLPALAAAAALVTVLVVQTRHSTLQAAYERRAAEALNRNDLPGAL